MSASDKNNEKAKRILANPMLLNQLRRNIADGSHSLDDVLSEILDAALRERLHQALMGAD